MNVQPASPSGSWRMTVTETPSRISTDETEGSEFTAKPLNIPRSVDGAGSDVLIDEERVPVRVYSDKACGPHRTLVRLTHKLHALHL